MTTRNKLATALTVVSIALLIPGLTRNIMTISASITMAGQNREIFRQTQSILQAVKNLHKSGNDFVAGLILLFSILVPFFKAITLFVILAMKRPVAQTRVYLAVRALSKWSMADVFVVGTFIAYLAAVATDNLDAKTGPGFYWFVSYCLVSNLAFQLLKVPEEQAA